MVRNGVQADWSEKEKETENNVTTKQYQLRVTLKVR
jgi:hypothetical protein